MNLQLVAPSTTYRDSFLKGLRAFQAEGLPWWLGPDVDLALQDFDTYVAGKLAEATQPTPPRVPKTHLWAVSDAQFVGRIAIHHTLNDALRTVGGHIGYDTVPSFRGRGVATEMLRQALPVARALGVTDVLITCDDDNAASIRVIERNGGVLQQTRAVAPSNTLKRFYGITLP